MNEEILEFKESIRLSKFDKNLIIMLQRNTGWNKSQVFRNGIKALFIITAVEDRDFNEFMQVLEEEIEKRKGKIIT